MLDKRFKTKTIDIPIYFGELTMVLIDDWAELRKIHPEQNIEDCFCAVVFTDEKPEVCQYVVAFRGNPSGQTMAHESVHIVNALYLDRRMRLDPVNDEPQAYLTGWVFNEIEKFLDEK